MKERIKELAGLIAENPSHDDVMFILRTLYNEAMEKAASECEEKQNYSMPIPCPDGIDGCLVAHYIPAKRKKTGDECADAIRKLKV